MIETDARRADVAHGLTLIKATREALEAGIVTEASPAVDRAPRLTTCVPVRACDLIDLPPPVEIIEGAVFADGVTLLPAESGTGKTFIILDMGAHVDADVPWHGRATVQGAFVYCGFEGDALGPRLRALRERGLSLDHVYIVRASEPISPRQTRDGDERSPGELALIAALRHIAADLEEQQSSAIRLIGIDTARAAMEGSEDSSGDVAATLRAVRRILATCPGAGLVLTHHAGWQDGEAQRKRERGSSAWRGNVDCTLYLEAGEYDADRGEGSLVLRTLKARDAERSAPLHLIRRRVTLAVRGRRGEPLTSCVIDRDPRSREDRESAARADAERAHRDVDLKTLRAIATQPEMATSLDRIRVALGTRKAVVTESVARLVQAGWLLPGRQRQPYAVTEAGWEALNSTSAESFPVVPGRSMEPFPSSSPVPPPKGDRELGTSRPRKTDE